MDKTPDCVAAMEWMVDFSQARLSPKKPPRINDELRAFLASAGAAAGFSSPFMRDLKTIDRLRNDLVAQLHWRVRCASASLHWQESLYEPLRFPGYLGLIERALKLSMPRYIDTAERALTSVSSYVAFIAGVLSEPSNRWPENVIQSMRHQLFLRVAARLASSAEGKKRIQVCAREGCNRICLRRKGSLYCGPKCRQAVQNRNYYFDKQKPRESPR
jgi:hypothetical protein